MAVTPAPTPPTEVPAPPTAERERVQSVSRRPNKQVKARAEKGGVKPEPAGIAPGLLVDPFQDGR